VNRRTLDVSLIIPAYNEEASIPLVVEQAARVLDQLSRSYEILVVNDGSTDRTLDVLMAIQERISSLRVISVDPRSGQSAAFGAGFKECRGQAVVLMDGDGQNDPADIPAMLDSLSECDACCGYRAARNDTWSKRVGSRIANSVRRAILRDGIQDTGCSLKAIKAEFLQTLPMELKGMHRFLPALLSMQGARLTQVPVNHRPRMGGQSKYTNLGRLGATVLDVLAVRWMQARYRRFSTTGGNYSAE
jgi:glycosyltransferase involved in cell wall biosynthesis